MGRYERIFSLVLPIPPGELEKSAAYQALEGELRQSPFATKIAWDLLSRRRERLHATICGSLSKDVPYRISDDERAAPRQLGPLRVEVRGLFNFVDHLEAVEAAALHDLIQRWWDRSILTVDLNALWLLGASDDLVLDAGVEDVIPLR